MTKFIGRARWRPTVVTRPVRQRLRRVATAIGLFLLAPLVGSLLTSARECLVVMLPLMAPLSPSRRGAAWVCDGIVASRGRVRVDDLAAEVGCSRKRLWSRFRSQVGLSPKRAAMLVRFD